MARCPVVSVRLYDDGPVGALSVATHALALLAIVAVISLVPLPRVQKRKQREAFAGRQPTLGPDHWKGRHR